MEYWWKSLAPKQQVAVIVAMIGAIGGIRSYDHFWCMTGKGSGVTCW